MEIATGRTPITLAEAAGPAAKYFGIAVFGEDMMKKHLSEEAFLRYKECVASGERIDRILADRIAGAMKSWAIEKGATHYTHWFQPLTGTTAEKHDAFLSLEQGEAMDAFSGGQLIQQEPDASSFPNGGIRSTFEARGYSAWDPDSPAFIRGNTLCIPSVFVSYNGESLDNKTPLLRAISAMDAEATKVVRLFDPEVNHVVSTLGWEQEYFLVDSALYNARPDMVLTGRTVFGHSSAKNQQLEDHYFGVIPERVDAFMTEMENEAHQLGIPVKTRHNEVAPSQFECAPVYCELNRAVDQNQLIMDLIKKTARRHHFEALLHEKPYAGVNGSGKHNNWSWQTDTGINLLAPGANPEDNFRFVTFLVNIIKAVHDHSDLLRASIASAGNELRLGGNEAPPAIISMFIGEYLTQMLKEPANHQNNASGEVNDPIKRTITIGRIPEILRDNTDRNRTSPFAFTGNKFEFRAVGSSANCSWPMTVLNTIVASQLKEFSEAVTLKTESGVSREEAILPLLTEYLKEAGKVLFEGNNYDEEWVKEAAARGLPNVKSTPEALGALLTSKATGLFGRMQVLSENELHARYETELEKYIKRMQIEGRIIGDLAINHIIPVAIRFQNVLLENIRGMKEVFSDEQFGELASPVLTAIEDISCHIRKIYNQVALMTEARRKANQMATPASKAHAYYDMVVPRFQPIRDHADSLELLVDDELWPLPKYRELLFTN